jgi:hypothetical protein
MRRKVFEGRFPIQERFDTEVLLGRAGDERFCDAMGLMDMGLAPGGRMRQEIYDDPYDLSDWDTNHTSRCFVHIANSLVWRSVTGKRPPTVPRTAKEYDRHGLPWFDYYDDGASAVAGSGRLKRLKSVVQLGKEKGDVPLPENESTPANKVIRYRKGLQPGQVREGSF